MVKELQYTSINRVLDDVTEHPLLSDLTLEQAIRHTIRFIGLHGYPQIYQDKIEDVKIHAFRGLLPCDLISIVQVKDKLSGVCLRSMTDNFPKGLEEKERVQDDKKEMHDAAIKEMYYDGMTGEIYIPRKKMPVGELAFKTQERVIFTSFPEGCVEVAYKAIPVDENGFPLLIDNENYLAALEAYIKKQVFIVKFDTGKISAGVLQNAKQDYAWAAGQLRDEMVIPSISEMEAITRAYNTLIPQVRRFDDGFKHLGDREYLRKH